MFQVFIPSVRFNLTLLKVPFFASGSGRQMTPLCIPSAGRAQCRPLFTTGLVMAPGVCHILLVPLGLAGSAVISRLQR